MTKNTDGQPNSDFSQNKIGVMNARPTDSAAVYTAMQVARSFSPNHVVAMRLLMRKVGTSKNPTAMRSAISDDQAVGQARSISVASDHSMMIVGYRMRGMHPVHQPAARKLERRVGPAEGGKHQAELNRIEMKFAGQAGRGDRDVAAIEVVDDDGNEQQPHDAEPPVGRSQRVCLRRTDGLHAFPPDYSDRRVGA